MGMPRLAELASDAAMDDINDSGSERLSQNFAMEKKMAAVATAATAVTSRGAAKTSARRALLRVSKSSAGLATKKVRELRTCRAFSPRIFCRPTNQPTRMMHHTTKKPANTPSKGSPAGYPPGRGGSGY